MNKIKFRVWDYKNIFWHDPKNFNLEGKPLFTPGFYQEFGFSQFTGLYDRKGKEIYEGDILKFANLNYEVIWGDGKFEATCPNYCKYNWPKFEYFGREAGCSEVVGNIFENLDLLK